MLPLGRVSRIAGGKKSMCVISQVGLKLGSKLAILLWVDQALPLNKDKKETDLPSIWSLACVFPLPAILVRSNHPPLPCNPYRILLLHLLQDSCPEFSQGLD